MAILKHIANKSKIYSGAEQYLCFEHDAKTGKPLLDDQGRMIARKGILKDAINCDFDSFAAECMETNNLYHKNKGTADIKSHDYILSFDPKDNIMISISINGNGNIDFNAKFYNTDNEETAQGLGHTYRKLLCACFDLAIVKNYMNHSINLYTTMVA